MRKLDKEGIQDRYWISEDGAVWTNSYKGRGCALRVVSASINHNGYLSVDLAKAGGGRKRITNHQLVAVAYLNHKIDGVKIVVDHIDNNKLNNHYSNLQLTSVRNNTTKEKTNLGSSFDKKRGNYRAMIKLPKKSKNYYLGGFPTPEQAMEIYQAALKFIEKCKPTEYQFNLYRRDILGLRIKTK